MAGFYARRRSGWGRRLLPFCGFCLLAFGCAQRAALPPCPRASPCPTGTSGDARRAAALKQLLERDPEAAALVRAVSVSVCFAPGNGPGVLSGELVLLDIGATDFELAARLGHLLVHRRDDLGEGCARGLVVARESERKARLLESRLRAGYGLPPIATAQDAERDYQARCPTG